MARMVGAGGRVIAVDIQVKMLERVRKKAKKHGLAERILCHTADTGHIGMNQTADFILAYYMIHETPDITKTLQELKAALKDGGKILVVEPKMHVSRTAFEKMIQIAESVGLKAVDFPKGKGGRCVVWAV
jgi:ubiquinone/menaquinone biosynthesis C-methylase UbiE